MFNLIIVQSSDPERSAFILKDLLLFTAGFLITWAPSLAIRHRIFKEPVPRWVGLLVAFLTFLLGMVIGPLLTGTDRPGIHGAAAVCAYFTVTRSGKAEEQT